MAFKQGFFKPKNPTKYKGDATQIVYRSGWELRLMSYFDMHEDVLWWSSEEKIIPYRSPVDNKIHRYFPDFLINIKNKEGKTETVMIEVKPKSQTKEPKRPSKVTKKYINEVFTYGVNQNKWKAAEEFCADRGWRFMIMTEEEIFGKKS
jgi:hypothetical protein